MSAVVGRRLDSVCQQELDEGVAAVVERVAPTPDGAERVVVVPDVHYPFHPSTGLVTNPDAVESLVAALDDAASGASVAVGYASGERMGSARAARILGYGKVAERTGCDLLDLEAAPRVEAAGERVPEPLVDATVVNAPTLRRTDDPAAGLANLSVAADAPIEGVGAACDPALTLLDGSYTHPGEPRRSAFLLASDDARAVDAVAARLFDADPASFPGARAGADPDVEGVDVDAIAADLPPDATPEEPMGDALKFGYRVYATLTGDVAPPEVLGVDD